MKRDRGAIGTDTGIRGEVDRTQATIEPSTCGADRKNPAKIESGSACKVNPSRQCKGITAIT